MLRLERHGRRRQDTDLCRRQVPALDLSGRYRAGRCSPTRSAGASCPSRSPTGCACSSRSRSCPAAATCWSRPFRAATATTWSAYPFEGRLAHQTLGMLLTRRLERAGARPLGFVATDYSLAVWAFGDLGRMFRRGEPKLAELVRRGHAGRRPRGLAGRELPAQAHVPQLRDHLGPDRAAPSRQGEERAAGDGLFRPDLRRAENATSPTTSCCRRRGPTRRASCSMSGG